MPNDVPEAIFASTFPIVYIRSKQRLFEFLKSNLSFGIRSKVRSDFLVFLERVADAIKSDGVIWIHDCDQWCELGGTHILASSGDTEIKMSGPLAEALLRLMDEITDLSADEGLGWQNLIDRKIIALGWTKMFRNTQEYFELRPRYARLLGWDIKVSKKYSRRKSTI